MKSFAEFLNEAKATYCGRCGTTHVPPSEGGTCPALKKEEAEQIDEISKEKTQKYLDRAMGDHDHQNMARRNTTGDAQKEYARKEALRKKGISRAVDRLYPNNEEVDLEESHQVIAKTKQGETFKSAVYPTKEKALAMHYKMSKSGNYKSIETVPVKEEAEQLDEISDKTLQSYRSKAHTQIQHYKYAGGKEKPEAGEVLAKREPGMKRATDKVIKKDAEARAAAPKRPPAQHKDKYPLGGRDEVSGRSYSEEVELDEDFTKMDTSTLKKWITTRERNSMAANLSKKRSDQYDQATAELKRRREVKEGVEQVDELNQMTLSRYAAAAKSDVAKQAHTAGTTDSVDDAKKAFDKAKKRQAGISTANRKMRFGEYSEMVDSQSENNK